MTTRRPATWRRRVRWAALAITLLVAAVMAPVVHRHLAATVLLLRLSGAVTDRTTGATGWLAHRLDHPLVVRDLVLPGADGPLRARLYLPRNDGPFPAMVVGHGVHYLGIDEPRLVVFARALARAGVAVLTPQLDAVADYRVDASSAQVLQRAVAYAAAQPWARGHRTGLVGLSFAGGLALLAATDDATRARLTCVVSIGGHHDLARVSRYLALDELTTPEGMRHARSHDYGLVVIVYAYADRFVDAASLPVFRDALRTFLHGDRRAAQRQGAPLTGDAAWLLGRLLSHDKPAVAPRVLAVLPGLTDVMRAASPAGRLARVDVPVYLLHGARDDVIPPAESRFAARELAGHAPVHLALTPLVDHVTVQRDPTAGQQWEMVRFIAGMLGE